MNNISHNECLSILEEHGVKVTANRLMIVDALLDAGRPLSLSELEICLGTVDKSIISRTLALLKSKRLVHVVEAGDEGSRYEMCHCPGSDVHADEHVHFYCRVCHRTFCLEDVSVPGVNYPSGFRVQSVSYVAEGVCAECMPAHGDD